MRPVHRRILAAVLMPMFAAGALAATPPVTGLGQSWPNAPDASASPRFHAYRFEKQGVHYLQINGSDGNVRGAIAIIDGEPLDLPMGVDAAHWVVATDPVTATTGEMIYHDDTVTVRAASQPDGTMRLMLVSGNCNGNPADCSMKGP